MIEDDKLVSLAQKGDEYATEELMKRYRESVNRISRSFFLVGGEIEDIAQEGLIGLYKGIMNYDPKREASFKTFALLCIKHQIHNLIKKAGSLKSRALSEARPLDPVLAENDDEGLYIPLPIDDNSPETELIAKEERAEFDEKTEKLLSKFEKEVLSLYLKGYSYDEISVKLEVTKKNIDNALTRIKTKLSKP